MYVCMYICTHSKREKIIDYSVRAKIQKKKNIEGRNIKDRLDFFLKKGLIFD